MWWLFTRDHTISHNQTESLICLDEKPYVLRSEVVEPLNTKTSSIKKYDYEYKRHGYCAIFDPIEPHTDKQYVDVRKTRTACDFAEMIK